MLRSLHEKYNRFYILVYCCYLGSIANARVLSATVFHLRRLLSDAERSTKVRQVRCPRKREKRDTDVVKLYIDRRGRVPISVNIVRRNFWSAIFRAIFSSLTDLINRVSTYGVKDPCWVL